MQIHHLVITLHILEIVTVLTFSLMCVKKIIHPPQLDNEQHMVISELNMLLLAKGEMYNIDGFTKSNIDVFVYMFCMYMFIFYVYCIYLSIVYHFVYDQ